MRVLVTDPIAADGLEILREQFTVVVQPGMDEAALVREIGAYDALIVRSGTQVTRPVIQAGFHLQVIGRAGVGVDNIDVDAATERGILVVNAPDGNSIAAAEHTIAVMLALVRHIPQADCSLREHKWERKRFLGVEVTGKTLGVIGMGRIGREVARRGRGLGMRVLAYDPYVSHEHAERLGVELRELDHILARADILTVHVPLTSSTRGLIGRRELALLKPTARVINCARGGIVDEEALQEALGEGRLAGAALDVFAQEPPLESPLLDSDKVVVTPHLGASTREAQVAVAVDVAHQVQDVLSGRPPAHPVNAPFITSETQAELLPFGEVAEKLGLVASQLVDRHLGEVRISYAGRLAELDTDLLRALLIKGLLQSVSERRITLVNASLIARERGLRLVEEKTGDAGHFRNLITLHYSDNGHERVLSGTVMHGEPYITRIDAFWLDFVARGSKLFIYHRDQPGRIGEVGRITGQADVNIAAMAVGRLEPRGQALMVLTLDEPAPETVIAEIEALSDVQGARLIDLG
jgi:D-3-phosphoglycerate dehydrogenase